MKEYIQAMSELAEMLALFRRKLIANHFTRAEALELVIAFLNILMTKEDNNNG